MKRVLILLTAIIIVVNYAVADDIKEVQTNPIVVTGSRQPALYSELSRVVTVIESEQIVNSPVKNVEELLEYVASVDIRRRGGPSAQADFSMRGGTQDQTLILLNGIPMNSSQTGHFNGNLPIALGDIERIEILEGSGARVLGTNAFSGGINIITRKKKSSNSANLSITGGEYGFYDLNLSADVSVTESFKSYASVYKQKSDGYMHNTDTDVLNAFSFNTLETEVGSFALQFGANQRNYGANSFYTALFPEQFEDVSSGFAALSYAGNFKSLNLSAQVFANRLYNRFELFRGMNEAPDWYTNHNYHRTGTIGADFKTSYSSNWGISSLGLEIKREDIISNVLGKPMEKPIKVSGTDDDYYTKEEFRNNLSVFAEHSFMAGDFISSGGLMINSNSFFGTHIFGGIDLGYKLSDENSLFLSVNRSGRLPNFTELYYEGGTDKGNPNLKPEHSLSFEIGTKYIKNYINASFSVFHNRGSNLIDWIKLKDTTLWEAQNVTKLNTFGLQTSLTLLPKQILGENCLMKFVTISYNYISSDKDSDVLESTFALDYLRHKLVFSAGLDFGSGFGTDIRFSYQEREGTYYSYEQDAELPYDKVMLAAMRFHYEMYDMVLFLDIDNVFDSKYQDIANIILPGRWLRAGFGYSLN